MSKAKGGAISKEDREFILKNMSTMSIQEMAEKLNRNALIVEKVIKSYTNLPDVANQAVRWRLKKSNHWKQLKNAFTESELSHIEDMYVMLVQQFKEDIYATEEIQILDFIQLCILQQRNLEQKQKIQENMNNYAKMAQDIEGNANFSELTPHDKDIIMDLKNKQAACMQAESNRTVEWLSLQKEKDVLYEKIMGSRDQRVKEIMNTKVSFTSYVKQLLDKDKQLKESRFIELYSKAASKEFDRLSQPHKYADDVVDNPILSAEVIEYLESQEQEENKKEEIDE